MSQEKLDRLYDKYFLPSNQLPAISYTGVEKKKRKWDRAVFNEAFNGPLKEWDIGNGATGFPFLDFGLKFSDSSLNNPPGLCRIKKIQMFGFCTTAAPLTLDRDWETL